MTKSLKESKGVTLIELMVALVMSAIVIAGLYRSFIGQQKTFSVQEQVVDMQQNARIVMNKVMRDIRMAGFGNVANVLPAMGYSSAFTMNANNLTVIGAFQQIRDPSTGVAIKVVSSNGNSITLSKATEEFSNYDFICLGGLHSYTVQGSRPRGMTDVLALDRTPVNAVDAYVYKVVAVTYSLDNIRNMADNIEAVEFTYLDANGSQTAVAGNVRMIRVAITARTKDADSDYKGADGYRRRVITSNVGMRNIGLSP